MKPKFLKWRFAAPGTSLLLIGLLTGKLIIDHPVSISRQNIYGIGIYAGESPLSLNAASAGSNPVLTAASVNDVKALFVADPFMLYADSNWYMFFEVFNELTQQGDIGLAVSPDGLDWRYSRIVLDESFHLSYPYVFAYQNEMYMIPESQEANAVYLYRATDFPYVWKQEARLLQGAFVDNSLLRRKDKWYLFTCGDHRRHAPLLLFTADSLKGPWKEHPRSPVVSDDARIARPGGRVVEWSGKPIRYAQDSKSTYGKQVFAFAIQKLTPTIYEERPVGGGAIVGATRRGWNRHGMHHIDPHLTSNGNWIACVDGYKKILGVAIEY